MTPTSNAHPNPEQVPVLVFGDSTIAVIAVALLVKRGEQVVWAKGTGSRLVPVMPYLGSPLAWSGLIDAATLLDSESQEGEGEQREAPLVERGCFHRVHKNKMFKVPDYGQQSRHSSRKGGGGQSNWEPEQQILVEHEFRKAGFTPKQIEENLRAHLESHAQVQTVGSIPVLEFEIYEQGGEIQFAGDLQVRFKKFIYADTLSALKGLPKLATVLKHQHSASVAPKSSEQFSALQVVFTHRQTVPYPQNVGWVIPLNRDAGETLDRHVLGYFSASNQSVWTVFLKLDECDDNHEIMKKLRKLKQALTRAFESEVQNGFDFSKTIEKEQVRFELAYGVTHHQLETSESNLDYLMLSESFGLSAALQKLAQGMGLSAPEVEEAHSPGSPARDLRSDLDFLDRLGELSSLSESSVPAVPASSQ